MKYLIIGIIIIVSILGLPEALFAQMPGLPGPPDQAPLATGVGLLVAGGVSYAVYRLRQRD